MFREDHVRSIEIWTGSDELGHVLVRALVRASFRVRVQYRVVCIFYSNPVSRVRHTVTAQQEHWALVNMSLPFFFDSGIFNSLERKLFRRLSL